MWLYMKRLAPYILIYASTHASVRLEMNTFCAGSAMGPIVRGIAATIGFARESYLSRANRSQGEQRDSGESQGDGPKALEWATKSLDQDNKDNQLSPIGSEGEEDLPLYGSWELDEAQDEVIEADLKSDMSKTVSTGPVPQAEIPNLADDFSINWPLQDMTGVPRLDCSVIIPQRRPDSRKRGFIRAYSPVLAAKGISEACFLDFIDTFNVASQANPLLYTINLAALSANALPPGIGIAAAEAVRLAVDVSVEMQSRYRTNDFLRKMNKLWFLPQGLICFPMIWKPSSSSIVTSVALNSTAEEQATTPDEKKSGMSAFRASAGTSRGNVQFPDAAPLTFPVLDDLAESADDKSKGTKKKIAGSMKFANEYMDRRAQASYAMNNPESDLSHLGVRPQFKSRYSDPNHPAASGSLLGLITGGAISTASRRRYLRQNQKGIFNSGPGGQDSAAAVVDFLRDFRLKNVVRALRGKVSGVFTFRVQLGGTMLIGVTATVSCRCGCADERGSGRGAEDSWRSWGIAVD